MQNENLDITEQKKPASRMKYLQLVDYINSLIEDGTLQIGDQIPSLDFAERVELLVGDGGN